ncbi:MAG: aminoacyl-histidine dipeptidase [Bacteroidales bacterium]|jgi:dipeptidase D|nr:aminoacyl-histidine dipeptidase [Bacteroidales bacterium]
MNITDLKPSLVWKYFDEITKIPRPSKKEEKIVDYLVKTGKALGLDTKRDNVGNVLITKAATPGKEHLPTIVLQSHVDMVCEKDNSTNHNFDTDPIKTIIDGEWIKADGTTLGADNGIGVAAELALLASTDVEHGKIECLFTIDEETGLTGASAIQPGFFTGNILLNLDSEDEGEIFIGCAGGADTTASFNYQLEPVPQDWFFFKLNITKLNGGHSGCDIHRGHANANKLLARFLWQSVKKYDLLICSITGGNLRNAIPREAVALAAVPADDREKIRADFNIFLQEIETEYGKIELNRIITLETESPHPYAIDPIAATRVLNTLYACPHGVIAMSHDIPGLVETSTNLASVKMIDNKVAIGTSQRSSIESAKKDVLQMVESVFMLADRVTHGSGYPGWKPNRNSAVLQAAIQTYIQLFGVEPHVKAIHAGLECGLFLSKYPELDMISFGPTLREVHSPNERMHIPSVEKFWNFLLEMLKNYPAK